MLKGPQASRNGWNGHGLSESLQVNTRAALEDRSLCLMGWRGAHPVTKSIARAAVLLISATDTETVQQRNHQTATDSRRNAQKKKNLGNAGASSFLGADCLGESPEYPEPAETERCHCKPAE